MLSTRQRVQQAKTKVKQNMRLEIQELHIKSVLHGMEKDTTRGGEKAKKKQ